MYRKDYLMRMIEGLGAMVSSLLKHKAAGDLDGAQHEIDAACGQFLGLSLDTLGSFSDDTLLIMFGGSQGAASGRCWSAGVLLAERAALAGMRDDPEVSRHCGRKALLLFLEAYNADIRWRTPEALERINGILTELPDSSLTQPVVRRLVSFYELTGRFGKAEDVMYELENAGDWPKPAEAFYRRLLTLDDAKLIAGGLPRDEVEDGLASLNPHRELAGLTAT